jgi:hypothetical protein
MNAPQSTLEKLPDHERQAIWRARYAPDFPAAPEGKGFESLDAVRRVVGEVKSFAYLDAIYIAGWLAGGRVREMGVL